MDCSGFVSHVYGQVAGIQLPRSSQEISQHGTALEPVDLQPGDLVFFNTLSRAFSHVGVYLGENRFIHASSSQTGAVMVSDMNQPYWSKRFDGARRLLVLPDKESIPQP
jgi:cell wall-associated NlpC family hydrolase